MDAVRGTLAQTELTAVRSGPTARTSEQVTQTPALTIAITTFERPRYLRECLASIAEQTFTDSRILVFDNASRASYREVLEEFDHLNIAYERNSANIGASRNIEKAFEASQDTDFLMVFHDDDLMHPRMLEWQVAFLRANPESRFVATELAEFADGATPPRDAWPSAEPPVDTYADGAALARGLLSGVGLCFGSVLYRSEALADVRMRFDRFNMYWDRPFLLDIAASGPTAVLRAPLVLYRIHPAQDSRSDVLTPENLIALMAAYREALPKDWERADRDIFYRESARFLSNSYSLLARQNRPPLRRFLRDCAAAGVLRTRDLRAHEAALLLQADGRGGLVDAAQLVKRGLSRRQR